MYRKVFGYEDCYEVSDDGILKSLDRIIIGTKGHLKGKEIKVKGKEITLLGQNERYLYFYPFKKHIKGKKYKIARCVWEAFNGPIPEGYDIHHINHNTKDNRLENLCLIESHKHRKMHYEEKKEKMIKASKEASSKPVKQYTTSGVFIKEYPSAMEASRETNINNRDISQCCLCIKNHNSAGDYLWCFSGEEEKINEKVDNYKPKKKKIIQYTLDGQFVAEYESTMDAQRNTGIDNTNIGRCCMGKQKRCGDYIFKYKNNDLIAA